MGLFGCEYCHSIPHLPGCPNYVPKVVCLCANCGEEIYEGEDIYRLCDDEIWCERCVEDARTIAEVEDDD